MAAKRRSDEEARSRRKPATTPEELESQMIALAHDEAERQIRSGNASSQVLTHFLKLGSSRERLEQERIRHENELSQVKREAMQRADRMETLMEDAIKAMRSYHGGPDPETIDDEYG